MSGETQHKPWTWRRIVETCVLVALLIAMPLVAWKLPTLGPLIVIGYLPIAFYLRSRIVIGALGGGVIGFLNVLNSGLSHRLTQNQIIQAAAFSLLCPLILGAVFGGILDVLMKRWPNRLTTRRPNLAFATIVGLFLFTLLIAMLANLRSPVDAPATIHLPEIVAVILGGALAAIGLQRIGMYALLGTVAGQLASSVIHSNGIIVACLIFGIGLGTVLELAGHLDDKSPPEDTASP